MAENKTPPDQGGVSLFGKIGSMAAKGISAIGRVFGLGRGLAAKPNDATPPTPSPQPEAQPETQPASEPAPIPQADAAPSAPSKPTPFQSPTRPTADDLEKPDKSNPYSKFMLGKEYSGFKSSNVAAAQYDSKEGGLEVGFKNGGWYRYHDVSPTLAKSFYDAGSKGKWVWDKLRLRGTVFGHQKPYVYLGGKSQGYTPKYAETKKGIEQHRTIGPEGMTPLAWRQGKGPYHPSFGLPKEGIKHPWGDSPEEIETRPGQRKKPPANDELQAAFKSEPKHRKNQAANEELQAAFGSEKEHRQKQKEQTPAQPAPRELPTVIPIRGKGKSNVFKRPPKGPQGGIGGGDGGGGLSIWGKVKSAAAKAAGFGALMGGMFGQHKADGGDVEKRGGIGGEIVYATPGERVFDKDTAQKNMPLLESINRDGVNAEGQESKPENGLPVDSVDGLQGVQDGGSVAHQRGDGGDTEPVKADAGAFVVNKAASVKHKDTLDAIAQSKSEKGGLLSAIKKPMEWMRQKGSAAKDWMKERYGVKAASASMAFGQAASWGASAGLTAMTGMPIMLPPGSGIAAGIAAAELYRTVGGKKLKRGGEIGEDGKPKVKRQSETVDNRVKRLESKPRPNQMSVDEFGKKNPHLPESVVEKAHIHALDNAREQSKNLEGKEAQEKLGPLYDVPMEVSLEHFGLTSKWKEEDSEAEEKAGISSPMQDQGGMPTVFGAKGDDPQANKSNEWLNALAEKFKRADSRKPKSKGASKALYQIVQDMGGISMQSLDQHGFDTKAYRESVLGGLFRKNGGRDISEIAGQLNNEGHINLPDVEYHGTGGDAGKMRQKTLQKDAAEHVMKLLRNKTQSLHVSVDDQLKREEKKHFKEREDAKRYGFTPSDIATPAGTSEEDSYVAGEKGDAWEGPDRVAEEDEFPVDREKRLADLAKSQAEPDPWDVPRTTESSTPKSEGVAGIQSPIQGQGGIANPAAMAGIQPPTVNVSSSAQGGSRAIAERESAELRASRGMADNGHSVSTEKPKTEQTQGNSQLAHNEPIRNATEKPGVPSPVAGQSGVSFAEVQKKREAELHRSMYESATGNKVEQPKAEPPKDEAQAQKMARWRQEGLDKAARLRAENPEQYSVKPDWVSPFEGKMHGRPNEAAKRAEAARKPTKAGGQAHGEQPANEPTKTRWSGGIVPHLPEVQSSNMPQPNSPASSGVKPSDLEDIAKSIDKPSMATSNAGSPKHQQSNSESASGQTGAKQPRSDGSQGGIGKPPKDNKQAVASDDDDEDESDNQQGGGWFGKIVGGAKQAGVDLREGLGDIGDGIKGAKSAASSAGNMSGKAAKGIGNKFMDVVGNDLGEGVSDIASGVGNSWLGRASSRAMEMGGNALEGIGNSTMSAASKIGGVLPSFAGGDDAPKRRKPSRPKQPVPPIPPADDADNAESESGGRYAGYPSPTNEAGDQPRKRPVELMQRGGMTGAIASAMSGGGFKEVLGSYFAGGSGTMGAIGRTMAGTTKQDLYEESMARTAKYCGVGVGGGGSNGPGGGGAELLLAAKELQQAAKDLSGTAKVSDYTENVQRGIERSEMGGREPENVQRGLRNDTQENYNVAGDTYGIEGDTYGLTPESAPTATAAPDGGLDVGQLLGIGQKASNAASGVGKAASGVGEAASGAAAGAAAGVEGGAMTVGAAGGPAGIAIAAGVMVFSKIAETGMKVVDTFVGLTKAAMDPAGTLRGLAALIQSQVGHYNPGIIERFNLALDNASAAVGFIFVPVIEGMREFADEINVITTGMGPGLRDMVTSVIPMVRDAMRGGLQGFATAIGAVTNALTPIFQELQSANIGGIVAELFRTVGQNIADFIQVLRDGYGVANDLWKSISGGKTIIESAINALRIFTASLSVGTDLAREARDTMKGWGDGIKSWLGDMKDTAAQWGVELINMLPEGVRTWFGELVNGIVAFKDGVMDFIRGLPGSEFILRRWAAATARMADNRPETGARTIAAQQARHIGVEEVGMEARRSAFSQGSDAQQTAANTGATAASLRQIQQLLATAFPVIAQTINGGQMMLNMDLGGGGDD